MTILHTIQKEFWESIDKWLHNSKLSVRKYAKNLRKFRKRLALTPPHTEPIGRFWKTKRLSCLELNFTNIQSSFMKKFLLLKSYGIKHLGGGAESAPWPNRVKLLTPILPLTRKWYQSCHCLSVYQYNILF